MLLTFTGRKSGKEYVVAIRYLRDGEHVVCFTDSKWWLNLRGGAPVEMLLAGRKLRGIATPVEDRATVARRPLIYLVPNDRQAPNAGRLGLSDPTTSCYRPARFWGWRLFASRCAVVAKSCVSHRAALRLAVG